jgi:hypothetical protein
VAENVLSVTTQELVGSEMTLSLLLPAEDSDIFERADAVSEWVNHFISGLGLVNVSLQKASEDVKEALADLEEMGKLGIDEDDDLAEQADLLEQVIEHIKVCVLTIHAEYGMRADKESQKPTIH